MVEPIGEREQRLEDMGYPIGRLTPEGALVDAVVIDGSVVYASGQVPFDGDGDMNAKCDMGAYEYGSKPYELFLPLLIK